jgi:hypothetical protein
MTHITYDSARRRRRKGHSPLFSPLLVLATVAVGAAAFVGYVLWPRWPSEAVSLDAPALPIVVAGAHFNVEPAAVRRPVQRRPGVYDRIDLSYLWPSLIPPDPALKPTPDNPIDPNERIFVTIASGETTFPMPERVRTIYPRYLASSAGGTQLDGGLTLRPFRDGTPYTGEDLIADEKDEFLARCTRKGIGNSGICLYERRIGEADVTVRFPREWLADAPGLIAGLNRLLGKIVAVPK